MTIICTLLEYPTGDTSHSVPVCWTEPKNPQRAMTSGSKVRVFSVVSTIKLLYLFKIYKVSPNAKSG